MVPAPCVFKYMYCETDNHKFLFLKKKQEMSVTKKKCSPRKFASAAKWAKTCCYMYCVNVAASIPKSTYDCFQLRILCQSGVVASWKMFNITVSKPKAN